MASFLSFSIERTNKFLADWILISIISEISSNQKKNHSLAMAEVLNYEVIDYKLDSLVHETEKGAILYCLQE